MLKINKTKEVVVCKPIMKSKTREKKQKKFEKKQRNEWKKYQIKMKGQNIVDFEEISTSEELTRCLKRELGEVKCYNGSNCGMRSRNRLKTT